MQWDPINDKWGTRMPVSRKSDIRSEIEEIDADIIGILAEIQDAKERLFAAKAQRAVLKAELESLRTR